MKKPPDKYKCIKKQIKDVFTDTNDINKIHNAVKRSNQVYIKVLMLLKIYTLQEYELLNTDNVDVLPQLPLITNETIGLIQRSVCLSKTNGRQVNDVQKKIFIEHMRDIQKSINNFSRVDGLHLSSILKYQETEIITVVENNIKQHYMFEYINRFVNVVFNAKGSLNPDIKKELHKVKNDLRTGTLTCNMKYHKWLNKYRYMIVPREYEESYYYDIKKYPQKYLVNMLWVNKMLDVYGAKKYNFLPQRTDIIIKYSQIDTKAIIEILDKCNKTVCLSDLTNNQNDIWNTYSSIKRKYSKDYMFDYCIITDGYACSIRYVEKTQYENQLQKKEKMRKGRLEIKGKSEEEKKTIRDIKAEERKEKEQEKITNKEKIKSKKTVLPDDEKDKAKKIKPKKTKEEKYIEFPYIDEIDSMDLLTIKNPCQCDPGLQPDF